MGEPLRFEFLRFSRNETLFELGRLVSVAYSRGVRPVRVAFEDPRIPGIIVSNGPLNSPTGPFGGADLISSLFESLNLPDGKFRVEQDQEQSEELEKLLVKELRLE